MFKGNLRGFVLTLLIAIAIAFVAITQVPIRMQGRVIEIVTFGEWPLEWAVRRQFSKKQSELRAIVDFVDAAPAVSGLTLTPTGIRTRFSGENAGEARDNEENVLKALISVQADAVVVHEDRISVVLGSEDRGDYTYEVAFIYPLQPVDRQSCETISGLEKPKIGRCVFPLGLQWHVSYQWYPRDAEMFQKAVDELTD